jgi:hypothetical protein
LNSTTTINVHDASWINPYEKIDFSNVLHVTIYTFPVHIGTRKKIYLDGS